MTKPRWRLLFSFLSVLAILAVAVACGDDDDDDGPSGGSVTKGGTITMGALQFESWDPHFADFAQDIAHFYKVWRGLYQFDKDGKPIPSMAAGNPTITDGGKTYTVKLQSGLKWSDGTPLAAKDFVAGIQRTCDPDNAGHYQYILTAIVGCDAYYGAAKESAAKKDELRAALGVRAVDELTVEYKLTDPQPTFTILLAMWPTFPVPTHKVNPAHNAKWPGPLENVYNGPFKPSAYTEKDRMELVPNPNWAGKQKPALDKLVLRYIDDPKVQNDAYRSGELDIAQADTGQLDKLKTEFPKELVLYPATRTIGLEPNLKDSLMSNPNVRLALSQATDRDTLVKVVFQGGNVATTNWMPPARSGLALNAYKDTLGFNVSKAKESLSKAGFADGKNFPALTLLLVDTATNKALGEFLQAEWKKHLGIDLKLEFTDSKTRSARFNKSEFQLVTGGWQEDYGDPENWFLGLWETGGSINKTNTSIKALDELIGKAKFNQNDAERRKQYIEAEKLLLAEASGMAPLWHTLAKFLVKPHVQGANAWQRPGDTLAPGDWDVEYWGTSKK